MYPPDPAQLISFIFHFLPYTWFLLHTNVSIVKKKKKVGPYQLSLEVGYD